MTRPAYLWYPGDHDRDPAIQGCRLIQRGLWREMIDLMHFGEPYGHLTSGGVPLTTRDLARLVGEAPSRVATWLADLERRHVFSRTPDGTIFCRRMVRDEEVRNARAAGGSKSLKHPAVPRRKRDAEGVLQGYHRGTLSEPPQDESAVALAVATASSTAEADLRASIRESLPAEFVSDFDELLSRVDRPERWLAEIAQQLRGVGSINANVPTTQDMGRAICDFIANGKLDDPKLRQFRNYVTGAVEERSASTKKAQRRPAAGATVQSNHDDIAARRKRIAGNVQHRRSAYPDGPAWWERMEREAATAGEDVWFYAFDRIRQAGIPLESHAQQPTNPLDRRGTSEDNGSEPGATR